MGLPGSMHMKDFIIISSKQFLFRIENEHFWEKFYRSKVALYIQYTQMPATFNMEDYAEFCDYKY